MGGRGSSSGGGGGSKLAIANRLIEKGGNRWQKGDKDRIYLSRAISREVSQSTIDENHQFKGQSLSRSERTALDAAIRSAYYDVETGSFVYSTGRVPVVKAHIEKEIKRLTARRR